MINLEEQDIEARRKSIHEGLKTLSPQAKAHAGVIVTISREGDVEVIRGLVRDADRKALAAAVRCKGATDGNDRTWAAGAAHDPATQSAMPARRTAGCSGALTRRLAAHRTMALQALLAQNSTVALACLVHVFVLRVFGAEYPREASALQVSPQLSHLAPEAAADDLKGSRAWQVLQQAKDAWRGQLPDQQGAWLGWLMGRTQDDLIDLLALCSALTVNGLPGAGAAAGASAGADALAAAVGLEMADWWSPPPLAT